MFLLCKYFKATKICNIEVSVNTQNKIAKVSEETWLMNREIKMNGTDLSDEEFRDSFVQTSFLTGQDHL